jgi:glycine dehydrogenase
MRCVRAWCAPPNAQGRKAKDVLAAAVARGINLRPIDDATVGLNLDETTLRQDLVGVLEAFGAADGEVGGGGGGAASKLDRDRRLSQR